MIFKLIDDNRKKRCIDYILSLPCTDNWEVIIQPAKSKRTDAQNRLYWSWVHIFSNYTGYSDEQMHTIFKSDFLGVKSLHFNGKEYAVPNSTTKLTVKEFSEYMNKIDHLAMSMEIALPYPDLRGFE